MRQCSLPFPSTTTQKNTANNPPFWRTVVQVATSSLFIIELVIINSSLCVKVPTRWAPKKTQSFEMGLFRWEPYEWPKSKWITGVMSSLLGGPLPDIGGVITPINGRK